MPATENEDERQVMKGTTGLRQLEVDCIVGVYDHERVGPQPVLFDIELDYDFVDAARSDALEDAVDYDVVASEIARLAKERKFTLLETMAEETAALLFARLDQVQAIRMEIRKPRAVPAAECSFVRVDRSRP